MVGWGWDGFRKPSPVFHDTHNTLKLGVVFDGKRDPAEELRAFVTNVLVEGIKRAGQVWNGKDLVPMPMTNTPAPAPPPIISKEFVALGDRVLADVQSRFRKGARPWVATDSRVGYPEPGSQIRVISNNSFQDAGAVDDLRSITLVFRYDAAPGGGKGVARYFAYRNDQYKNNHEWYSLAQALLEIQAFLNQAFPGAQRVPTSTLVKLTSAMASKIEAAVKFKGGKPATALSPDSRVGYEHGHEIARYSLTWEYDGRRVGAEMWIRRPLNGGKPEFSVERVVDLARLPSVEQLARGPYTPAKVIGVFTKIVDTVAAANAADKMVRDRLRAEQAEKDRLEREEQERVKREAPTDYMAEITDALKRMRLGPVGGRVVDVDYYPGAHPSWSVEPSNRQRLDHYVGNNYDPGEDDDPEGWDQDGWDEEYAGPVSSAASKWLAEAFGSEGLFYVEVGDKGHLDIQLTPAGRMKFLPGAKTAAASVVIDGVPCKWVREPKRKGRANMGRAPDKFRPWSLVAPDGRVLAMITHTHDVPSYSPPKEPPAWKINIRLVAKESDQKAHGTYRQYTLKARIPAPDGDTDEAAVKRAMDTAVMGYEKQRDTYSQTP